MKPALIINTHCRTQYLEAALQLFKGQGTQIVVSHSGANAEEGTDMWRILRDAVKGNPEIIYMEPEKNIVENSIHITWNRALKKLLPEGYDPIFLGDESIVPSSQFISRIVSLMEDEPKLGMVGPIHQGGVPQQNIPEEDTPNFQAIKADFDILNLRDSSKRFQEAADKAHLRFRTVMGIESHIRAIRAQVFDQIGLLDEGYQVGWMGDSELCLEIRQKGWEVAVCYKAFIYHYRDLFHSLDEKNKWIQHDIAHASSKGWGDGSKLAENLRKDFVERTG